MPAPVHGTISLTVPADVRLLGVVRRVVESVGELADFSENAIYESVLAVSEACANVMRHGYGDAGGLVALECRVGADGVEFLIRDSGEPFDLASVPELPPDELREGGRGVFLIRRLMDEAASRPLPDGGNELRMFKAKG